MGSFVSSLFSRKTPEAGFWAWFQSNEDSLFHFERDQDRVFEMLRAALGKVHPDLTFEFGPAEAGTREFVISAGGIRTAFPAVESLHATAPVLPRWTFTKFRPRREPVALRLGDVEVGPNDIEVAIEADDDKAGLAVFVRGFDDPEDERVQQIAFLMLDHAIGEYDMETKVGFIEVRPFEAASEYARHPLAALPHVFDRFLAK
jgi:hypothetical protein